MTTKVAQRLAVGDVVTNASEGSTGTVLMVRKIGRFTLVKFTSGATRLYRYTQHAQVE